MKIIYSGFGKTGSRSIGDFIESIIGYKSYVGRTFDLHSHPTKLRLGEDVYELDMDDVSSSLHFGKVNNPVVYDYLRDNKDMIARDFPYFGMYKYINENYEDSKFIICIRETESLLNSYKNHNEWLSPIARNKANYVYLGVNGPYKDEYKERLKITYELHNYRVLEYFKDKPGKLLVLKFEEIGTEKFEKQILDFLGLENPENVRMKNIK